MQRIWCANCNQAFRNPFRHPHTGESQLISTFYVVNGGSFSDQAATHFFASVRPVYGDNVRLLDGKALLQLDRSAALMIVEGIRTTLSGLRLEINFNLSVASYVYESLNRMLVEDAGYPMQRLRAEAVARVLERPLLCLTAETGVIQTYWQDVMMFNRIVDSIDVRISAEGFTKTRIEAAQLVRERLSAAGARLLVSVETQLRQLGSLLQI